MFTKNCKVFFICLIWSATSNGASISIDSVNQQQVTGWGICTWNRADWGADWVISPHANVCDAAYSQLGATHLRIDLSYGNINVNGIVTDSIHLISVKRHILAATGRGLTYFISIWTPPPEMKIPATASGSLNGVDAHLRTDREDLFVQRVTEAINWLMAQGCPLPAAFSFQNEPDYNPWYDGCVYDPVQYQRVAKKFRAYFDSHSLAGLKLHLADAGHQIALLDLLGSSRGDLGALDDDEVLNAACPILSVHTYDMHNGQCETWNTNILDRYVKAITGRNKEFWMTEYSAMETTENTWQGLINTVRHMNRDMSTLRLNLWSYFMIWAEQDGLFVSGTSATAVTRSPWFYVFSKIWNNARPGSYVRQVTTTDADLKGYGLYNCAQDFAAYYISSSSMVLVVTNPTANNKTLDINGLVGSLATVYRMNSAYVSNTDMGNGGSYPVANKTLRAVQFPANTISVILTGNGTSVTHRQPSPLARSSTTKSSFEVLNAAGQVLMRLKNKTNAEMRSILSNRSGGVVFIREESPARLVALRVLSR